MNGRLTILCLLDLRNSLIAEGRHADCVDGMIEKFVYAKKVKIKIR